MANSIDQSIYQTLAYFDLFNFPLTKEELFRYLWMPPRLSYQEVFGYLHDNPTLFVAKYGYYFLPGREEIVETRRRATVATELKLIRARRAVRLIRSVPFLRAIFVCNSVGADNAAPESDIDFFIIAEAKRIWIVRLFSNLILLLFGMRRHGDKISDRICLSFYVDTTHLDLAPWRVADDDVHFAYWLHGMLPLYDQDNYYKKFIEANSWTKKYLPNATMSRDSSVPQNDNTIVERFWKLIWEKMWGGAYGDIIERQAESFQRAKMKFASQGKEKNDDKGVVVEDGVLKFHERDTRRAVRERWCERVKLLKC